MNFGPLDRVQVILPHLDAASAGAGRGRLSLRNDFLVSNKSGISSSVIPNYIYDCKVKQWPSRLFGTIFSEVTKLIFQMIYESRFDIYITINYIKYIYIKKKGEGLDEGDREVY